MRSRFRPVHAVAVSLYICACTFAAAPLVAPSGPLTPQEQIKKFKLPPGFEIQLVASEPDINKPMNMNFDSRGRLWVTTSIEYPWPAKDADKARDRIMIFSDLGNDGLAKKKQTFADKLNIPIGILPLKGGKEAIAWSIPNIWKLTDTDGDDVADQREIMFGPFDFVDTHGNQNAFRYHLDGWVYANHGFRNNSVNVKAKGQGPVVIAMNSGNTYRFKPDGSKIELWSAGQVNPFGLTFDEWGNLYSADCHSKACTMVIRDAHYESFGKPHDGLGYGPNMTNHDHGSSGIGGIAYYSADHFPKEYRNCLYLGNVVTGIVHRDVIQWNGSTPWVETPVDFITCEDQWFRPVDIQLGPDGALYIADFYNCIIGHYEVDLKHPRRDRERGRIWRVVYKGEDGKGEAPKAMADLTKCSEVELLEALNSSNLVKRAIATNTLLDEAHATLRAKDVHQKIALPQQAFIHERMPGATTGFDPDRSSRLSPQTESVVFASIAHIQSEKEALSPESHILLLTVLADTHPMVVRMAADALGKHPDPKNIKPLLRAWEKAHEHDTALIHTIRLALRNQLRTDAAIEQLSTIKLDAAELTRLIPIALALQTESAAWFAFEYALNNDTAPNITACILAHVARNIGDGRISDVIKFVRSKYDGDVDQQLALFQSIHAGMKQRGTRIAPGSDMKKWAFALSSDLLDASKHPPLAWISQPLDPAKPSPSPFGLRDRKCDDGQSALFIDSIVNGEKLTGIFRSQPFAIPDKLSFHICGHNGLPGSNAAQTNHIRLRLTESDTIIAQQTTPRNDTAKQHTWDLAKWAGKQGVIEIVDADKSDSYAWIGVSRFEPAVVRVPSGMDNTVDRQAIAIAIAGDLEISAIAPQILLLLDDAKASTDVRIAACVAAAQLDRDKAIKPIAAIVQNPSQPVTLRTKAAQVLGPVNTKESRDALAAALASAPGLLQRTIAIAMTATSDGSLALLDTIAAGKASPRLLQDKEINERISGDAKVSKDPRRNELVKNLPAAEDRINKLIAERSARFAASPRDPSSIEKGLAVFKTNCAACHKVGDLGNLVGPQLNGVGIRGHERLLEDILDPNRNVDGAFRSFICTMKEGEIITGMKLREEGKLLVLADGQGKEIKLSTADIVETRPSALSPMPANFADTIAEADMFDLLAFLLSQKQASP